MMLPIIFLWVVLFFKDILDQDSTRKENIYRLQIPFLNFELPRILICLIAYLYISYLYISEANSFNHKFLMLPGWHFQTISSTYGAVCDLNCNCV